MSAREGSEPLRSESKRLGLPSAKQRLPGMPSSVAVLLLAYDHDGFECVCPGGQNGLNDCDHRNRVEGAHGEAKTQHGLRRAARRGLWNVAIQVYLTAAVMNLKRLAMAAFSCSIRFLKLLDLLLRPQHAHFRPILVPGGLF